MDILLATLVKFVYLKLPQKNDLKHYCQYFSKYRQHSDKYQQNNVHTFLTNSGIKNIVQTLLNVENIFSNFN